MGAWIAPVVAPGISPASEPTVAGDPSSEDPNHMAPEAIACDGFRQLLTLAGLEEDQWAQFASGDPLAERSLPMVLQILYRLRRTDAGGLDRWTQSRIPEEAWLADPVAHRAELAWVSGHVLSVREESLPESLGQAPGRTGDRASLAVCQVELVDSRRLASVIAPNVPNAWFDPGLLPQPVRFRGFLLGSSGDGASGEGHSLTLLASHLAWFPARRAPAGLILLAEHGMDVSLLDEVRQRARFVKPGVSREREAFYACLSAAERAGQRSLTHVARENLPKVADQWREAGHAAADIRRRLRQQMASTVDPAERMSLDRRLGRARRREAIAEAVQRQAAQGRYSVVPMFLEPERHVGHLTMVQGIARRAVKIAVDAEQAPVRVGKGGQLPDPPSVSNHGPPPMAYYELEVFPPDSQNLPVVCCVARLPDSFPRGDAIRQPVRVAGFFFKSWLYRTRQAGPRAGQQDGHQEGQDRGLYAPIVIGAKAEPIAASRTGDSRWPLTAGLGVLALLAAIWVLSAWQTRRDQAARRRAAAAGTKWNDLPGGHG